jgi:hypothetical protein
MSAVLPGGVPAARAAAGEIDRPIVEPHEPTAAERLEASRARLRAALIEIAHPPPKPSLFADIKIGSLGQQLVERLKALPGAALLLESIEHWWAQHPLHAAGSLAEEASRRYVGPIARENPVAVIVGSAVFGALFVASKPWRWLLRPALLFGLVPQIAAQALKRMPLDAWLQVISTLGGKKAVDKVAAAAAASPAPARPAASPAPARTPAMASGLPTEP